MAPGLIHLNTASLGATPRVVLDRTIAAWRELESSPVLMAYGNAENTVLSAVERVRKRAARFLGCEQDELLITRCTTDAMSIVAQGMRWAAGERVLTTNLEHDGGSLCWKGPQPLVIGLGAAIERMQDIGMTAVERHDLALRSRAYEQLTQIGKLRVISSPPGPSATAIVACVLPDDIDSMKLRDALLAKHGIIVKMSEKRHFNGFRLSPHIFNSKAHVDAAVKALREEIG